LHNKCQFGWKPYGPIKISDTISPLELDQKCFCCAKPRFCEGRDANLSDKQLQAIELTIQGYPDIRIADMLEIDRRTLWHWKTQNEDYRKLLFQSRDYVHTRVSDRYHDLLTQAWSVIEESLDHHRVRYVNCTLP
jgi:DNA-binding CsgD family transcriptional regulator